MKLATLKDRTRDGMLVVVSRDLAHCVSARPIAPTLQAALDDWEHAGLRLADLAHDLEIGAVPTLRFHESDAMAPLPRAYLRLDAGPSGAPLTLAAADRFASPRGEVAGAAGNTAAVGLAAIVGDVEKGADAVAARAGLLLIGLITNLGAATTLSPVLVTPDECAGFWDGVGQGAALTIARGTGQPERLDLGLSVPAGFDELTVAAAAKRPLAAGSVLASLPITFATTAGQRFRLEVRPTGGPSLFGAIELTVS